MRADGPRLPAGTDSGSNEMMTNSDEMMTRYLFGELSEAEQARLEERYFTDPATFDQLAQLETGLIDDYARGRLPAPMRARFERAYLHNPNRRARLKFGEALTARLDQTAAPPVAEPASSRAASSWQGTSSLPTGGHRALAYLAATVLLLLASLSVWLFVESRRLRQDLARIREAQSAQAQKEHEAEQQLASERARVQELTAEIERALAEAKPQPAPATDVATLTLTAGDARGAGAGAPPTLVIHKGTEQVRLQLKLKENEYRSYQLAVQAVGGKEVINRPRIRPPVTSAGASFVLALPASLISAGDYLLTLRGH